jgi:hypothetical protein
MKQHLHHYLLMNDFEDNSVNEFQVFDEIEVQDMMILMKLHEKEVHLGLSFTTNNKTSKNNILLSLWYEWKRCAPNSKMNSVFYT